MDNWEEKGRDGEIVAKSKGSTHISLLIIDDKIVGGVAVPVTDELIVGGCWSLDGKTMSEVHPDYQQWYDAWMERYK